MILKEDFIGIIDLYYPTMRYYQLIRLYFKIIDKENPYYYKPHYCKINFRKIHHNHHLRHHSGCCCVSGEVYHVKPVYQVYQEHWYLLHVTCQVLLVTSYLLFINMY